MATTVYLSFSEEKTVQELSSEIKKFLKDIQELKLYNATGTSGSSTNGITQTRWNIEGIKPAEQKKPGRDAQGRFVSGVKNE